MVQKKKTYTETADELAESWRNGNCNYVVSEVLEIRKKADMVIVLLELVELLTYEDRLKIARMVTAFKNK